MDPRRALLANMSHEVIIRDIVLEAAVSARGRLETLFSLNRLCSASAFICLGLGRPRNFCLVFGSAHDCWLRDGHGLGRVGSEL